MLNHDALLHTILIAVLNICACSLRVIGYHIFSTHRTVDIKLTIKPALLHCIYEYVYNYVYHKYIYILGLLARLFVPRPRPDRDYSRHNPRRDVRYTRRDQDVYINGRDETFVLLPHALHGTMRDACAAMPHNTPPLMSFPTQWQCEFKWAAYAGHFIVHACIVLLRHYYAGLLLCSRTFSLFGKIFRTYRH